MTIAPFQAFRIRNEDGVHRAGVEELRLDDLARRGGGQGRVLVGQLQGRAGRQRQGQDPARIRRSTAASTWPATWSASTRRGEFKEGDEVLVHRLRPVGGHATAATRNTRGWSRSGTIALPKPASALRESMALGTAGFTAALALYRRCAQQRPGAVDGAESSSPARPAASARSPIDILTQARVSRRMRSAARSSSFDDLIALGAKQCIARTGLVLGPAPAGEQRAGPARSTTSAASCWRA
jgi:hypothetical protein